MEELGREASQANGYFRQKLERGGFTSEQAERSEDVLRKLAGRVSERCTGKIQRLAQVHAAAMRDAFVDAFSDTGLAEAELASGGVTVDAERILIAGVGEEQGCRDVLPRSERHHRQPGRGCRCAGCERSGRR